MQHPRPRALINVVAWLAIVLSGIGILTAMLQNLAVHFWPPLVEVLEQTRQTERALGQGGQGAGMMMANMRWVLGFKLVLSISVFVCAVALLQRRNWARWVFVGLLALIIVLTLGNLLFALQAMPFGMTAGMAGDPRAPAMHSMGGPPMFAGALFAVLICLLLGWVLWQLCRAEVAAEFRR